MSAFLVILGVVVALAAAVRSTWSPCGQSMLSTITPLAERTRRHRFSATATWFVVGAVVGGVTLGVGAAVLAVLLGAGIDLSAAGALAVAAVGAAVAAASDAGVRGLRIPYHCRQVNELWLNRYRPWVYGAGFGWQIGVGLATFIMTAGVYLMIVLAVLTTSVAAAVAIGVTFGVVRGLAVFAARGITSPDALNAFHRRFDALGPVTRRAMITVEVAVAAAAAIAVASGSVVAGLIVLVAVPITVLSIGLVRRVERIPTT